MTWELVVRILIMNRDLRIQIADKIDIIKDLSQLMIIFRLHRASVGLQFQWHVEKGKDEQTA